MSNKQGLINFTKNIKPTMERCRDGKSLTTEEKKTIAEFYLEVLSYLFEN